VTFLPFIHFRALALAGCLVSLTPGPARAAAVPTPPPLDWRVAENRVSAQIDGWPVEKLLETIAARTRWQVFVDPAADHVVNAKFRDLPPGEALRRLLGGLNFALVPDTNSVPKLYVFRNSRQAATVRIAVPAGDDSGSRRLVDELIVTLKPGATESIEELARRLGAKVIGRSDELRAYRLKFENEAAADAARSELADGDVARADYNYVIDRPESAEALLAGGGLGLGLKPKTLSPGEGVIVAVVDTAIQGEAVGIKDFLLPAVSVAGAATPPADQLAHGTSMAATLLRGLAQVAGGETGGTSVRLLPVDVYGNNEAATTYEVALGLQAAINGGASIVNLSLGGEDPSPFIQQLIRAGRDRGVVFLAAAGNEPVTDPTFPAAYPEVVAVTALNRRGEVAAYANHGTFVDIGAPGTSTIAFWGQPYLIVGTSPATAYASAMAASYAASSGKRGAELEAELRRTLSVSSAAPRP
jgi:hypothetical protein